MFIFQKNRQRNCNSTIVSEGLKNKPFIPISCHGVIRKYRDGKNKEHGAILYKMFILKTAKFIF